MSLRLRYRPLWFRLLGVALLVFLAAWLRAEFLSVLGPRAAFVTFYPAVMLAAIFGGLGAGLLATPLSVLAAFWLRIEPEGNLLSMNDPSDLVGAGVFVVSCVLVSSLAEAMHRAQRRAVDAEARARLAQDMEKAESARREIETQYKLFIEYAPAAIAVFDTRMRYVAVSQRWLGDYGLSGQDILGLSHYEVFPEITDRLREIHWRCLTGAVERSEEDHFVRADGTTQWVRWEVRPWRSSDGVIGGIVIFSEDITESKTRNDALRKSELLLRILKDSIPDLVWLKNPGGAYLLCNTAFERFYGVKEPDLIGRTDHDFLVKELADFQADNDRKALEASGSRISERWLTFAEGGHHGFYETIKTPMRDEDGTLIGVLGISREITQRKRVEDDLRASEKRFRDLFKASPVSMGYLDTQGRLLDLNRSFTELFGYSLEDIPTLDAWRVKAYPDPDYRRQTIERWDAVMRQAGDGHRDMPQAEYRVTCKDGRVRDVLISGMGVGHGFLATLIDITELKRAENALRQAKEEAEAANRAKSAFLANMSHEIRTPLNGVMGILQLLQATELTSEQGDFVRVGIDSSRRLAQLLSDILDITRVESGRMDLRREAFPVDELLRSIKELFALQARKKRLRLLFDVDPAVPAHLIGDEMRLRQILFNLVGNALKFTQKGTVTVGIAPEGPGRLAFTVRDTGVGIPQARLADIFEPFTQVDDTYVRTHQGAGLGLTIVKRLVDLMGGSIAIESTVDEGTAVTVLLPLSAAELPPGQAPSRESPIPKILSRPARRLLIAEDDPANQFAMTAMLSKAGFEPTVAATGRELVLRLAAEDFDVVLMDINMPEEDGLEATRRIRAGQAGQGKASVPIIAMTAYAMAGDREKCLEAGMDGYVSKPVDLAVLLEEIEGVLENRDGRASPEAGMRSPTPA